MNARERRRHLPLSVPWLLCIALTYAAAGCSFRPVQNRSFAAGAEAAPTGSGGGQSLFRDEQSSPPTPVAPAPSEDAKIVLTAAAAQQPADASAGRRMVIYTANFGIVVKDIREAINSTERIAGDLNGYVQRIDGDTITIRVPAERFKDATDRLETLGQVSRRTVEAQDVTEEYVDLQARLTSALAFQKRLNALLDKAQDVKAALAVEQELKRINEEIERLQGKLKLLNNRIAFSTITVAFERVASKGTAPIGLQRLPFDWLRELDPNRLWQN